MPFFKRTLQPIVWVLAPTALFAGILQAQVSPPATMHITTQERLETEPWWPTMDSAPLRAYAGSASCTGCHAAQRSSSPTGMQIAAIRSPTAASSPGPAAASFTSGAFTYSLIEDKAALRLSAASAAHKATQSIDWTIGAGDLGRTYLYTSGGHWFQSQVSLYTHAAALDITTGFGPSTASSPAQALGNLLSPAEARACFGCHTVHASTSAGLDALHAEPGVGCEACHGPGQRHADAMAAGKSLLQESSAIFQPAKLSPSDSIDFCGSCHRSFADASLSIGPQADRAVVRFQPYRLEESKCWRTTQDERLTCVACHDPHKPLSRDAASYDANCLGCHSGARLVSAKHAEDQHAAGQHVAAVCPRSRHDCVTCHMPRINLPSMHGGFTDHYIRIAREGEPLPR